MFAAFSAYCCFFGIGLLTDLGGQSAKAVCADETKFLLNLSKFWIGFPPQIRLKCEVWKSATGNAKVCKTTAHMH